MATLPVARLVEFIRSIEPQAFTPWPVSMEYCSRASTRAWRWATWDRVAATACWVLLTRFTSRSPLVETWAVCTFMAESSISSVRLR